MRPRTDRKYFSLRNLHVCAVVMVLLFTALPALAATENVVVRQNISKSDREELALKLRTITGLSELTFNSDGALRIGNARVARWFENRTRSDKSNHQRQSSHTLRRCELA